MASLLRPRTFLVDTCVWIAYILGDAERGDAVARAFEAIAEHDGTLLYVPTSLADVFYIIPRELRRVSAEDGNEVNGVSLKPAAWAGVRKMTEIACAAPLSLAECELAWMLRGKHDDFEDNLVVAAAETGGADCIITYDKQLIERFASACATPEQVLGLLG